MPKGRSFVPSAQSDGIWHRGLPETQINRESGTSTGLMLTAPFKETTSVYPPSPPEPYHCKNERNFKTSNNFSTHDNRHSFQDHGVYFADGRFERTLGRGMTAPDYRQHSTDKDSLAHLGTGQPYGGDYNTVYGRNFTGRKCEKAPSTRRFPTVHPAVKEGLILPDTKTTSWFKDPEVPHKTPTHVLAISQEPFLRPNRWKYSYHGLHKCYPQYNTIGHTRENKFPTWLLDCPSEKSNQVPIKT